jgi:hypothetical protein
MMHNIELFRKDSKKTWKEYDEDAFIDDSIFDEILSLCNNGYFREDYFFYSRSEDSNFNIELNELQNKYIELINPTLNKNFVGFSSDGKIKRELFLCEFNSFVNKCNLYTLKPLIDIKKELWKLVLQLPDSLINKEEDDFIYYVCSKLKYAKEKKISEIFNLLNEDFSDTLSHQICDLLYNNFFPEKFKSQLYNLLQHIE